jgi:peptidyl-prolyl cis-trans isomerase B (cyclophilin B)
MAKHKAPTQVTLVPHEEKSALAEFVEKYWKLGAVLAVIVTATILYFQHSKDKESAAVDESWTILMAAVDEDGGRYTGEVEVIERVLAELQGSVAAPWALFLKAQNLRLAGECDEARSTLSQLKQDYPEHPLVIEKFTFGDSVTPLSLVEHMSRIYESEATWRTEHPRFFANPELPEDSPTVRFKTDRGDILVGLYAGRAPLHVENFLKLAGEGFFDGTKFHQVQHSLFAAGGDPATKETEPADWAQGGEGADYGLDPEESGLAYFEGYMGSVMKPSEEKSNGSLFYLTAAPVHHLDDRSTVYGKILEGLDVVREISESPTEPSPAVGGRQMPPSNRPQDPVSIISTEVVQGS